MKAKMILMTVAGLGLTGVLMAGSPQSDDRAFGERGKWQKGVHQKSNWRNSRGHVRQAMRRAYRRGVVGKMTRELDLTYDQRKQIRDIMKDRRKELRSQRRVNRGDKKKIFGGIDMSSFMSVDNFDKEAYIKQIKKRADRHKEEREARREKRLQKRAELMEKIFNILTPEEREKLIQLSQVKQRS